MATVERTCVATAPIGEVWAVLSHFGGISRWAPDVDHSCLMSEQIDGVGAIRRIQTDRSTVLETVETWESESTLSYRITGLPPVIKSVTNTWRLEAQADGTRITLTTEIDSGPRPPQQVVAALVGKRFASVSDRMLSGLNDHLEQRKLVTS